MALNVALPVCCHVSVSTDSYNIEIQISSEKCGRHCRSCRGKYLVKFSFFMQKQVHISHQCAQLLSSSRNGKIYTYSPKFVSKHVFYLKCICDACLSLLYHVCAGTCRDRKRTLDSLELELKVVVNSGCGCWGLNPCPLEHLSAMVSLQPPNCFKIKLIGFIVSKRLAHILILRRYIPRVT